MATYKATLETQLPAEEVFAYLSDFSNTKEWDPSTVQAERVDDGPIGEDSEFRLVAAFLGRESAITYRVVEYDPPGIVSFHGENSTVVSLDRIAVAAADDGSRITYDAKLTLKGWLKLADPLLAVAFKRLGDRALAGMHAALAHRRANEDERARSLRGRA
jgi:carbon monoxide dehydrogenase subunit G